MATPARASHIQSALTEYEAFWQLWPQFDSRGERRPVGFEVELFGSHTSDLNHIDFACPMCHRVRSVLLGIADLMIRDVVLGSNSFAYNIDSHSNSILCLPALGNRSAVSVSVNISRSRAIGQEFETELLGKIKNCLDSYGIHQR